MKGVADTSWLIAHFNANDRFHQEARAQFSAAESVFIPAAIWVEFQNVFQYRFGGHGKAVQASDQLRRGRNVRIGDSLDDQAALQVWRKHARLTYTDAVAIAEARRLGASLLTFERDQMDAFRSQT